MTARITDTDLSAFLDGELDARRTAEVERALAADPALAGRLEAFARDRRLTAALFAPVEGLDLPENWERRLSEAALMPWRPRLPRALPIWAALAASFVIALFGALYSVAPKGDPLITEALRAQQAGVAAPDEPQTPLPVIGGAELRAPDLARFGLALAATRVHAPERAVTFIYRGAGGALVTLFVRPSPGSTRFEMAQRGALRVCIWQDDVLTAVLAGHMEAGEMMRLAAAAYAGLSG
jgi:anti-sigma factor RsiW